MTFLKKFGSIALKGAQLVLGLAPMAAVALPGSAGQIQAVEDIATRIAAIIGQAEIMGQALSLPGLDKLKAAAPAVAQLILQSSLLAGKRIADPVLFNAGATKVADGFADILNSIHPDDMKTVDKSKDSK